MRTRIARIAKKDDGMATAEYAMVTVAAAGLGGLFIKLLTSNTVRDFLWNLMSTAISSWFA